MELAVHEAARLRGRSDHPYQTQFEAFFNALNLGQEMPLTSLAHALRTHEVIFAADNSATARAQAPRLNSQFDLQI